VAGNLWHLHIPPRAKRLVRGRTFIYVDERLLAYVYRNVRHTFWLLIVLAGTGGAQWRSFGEGQTAIASSSLARDMLAAHNAVRAQVGTAPLVWSERLAARSRD
jgi:hypothetical protein